MHWQDLDSDCPADGAWAMDEVGMALVEGDTLTLILQTTPELHGTLVGGVAEMNGAITFPGETGAPIDCVVAGTAQAGDDAIAGEMSEVMTSDGDLNCRSRARFTLLFDN